MLLFDFGASLGGPPRRFGTQSESKGVGTEKPPRQILHEHYSIAMGTPDAIRSPQSILMDYQKRLPDAPPGYAHREAPQRKAKGSL